MRKLLRRLPPAIRHPLMRRLFRFDPERCERFEVRPARTAEEYRAAFELVFEAYDAVHFFQGGNNPRAYAAKALFYPQAALPTSTVLIALDAGRIVGTTTLVRDTAMGIAADALLGDTKRRLASRGERLSELSMLAVAPSHRRSGEVLFAILRHASVVYMERERVEYPVCTTNRTLADALMGLMLFYPLTPLFRHPKSGATSMGLYLDTHDIEARARRAYRGAPRHRDLARFFFDDARARIRLPDPGWVTTTLPKLGPEGFPIAFGTPADFHEGLSRQQLRVLRNAFSPAMRDALPDYLPAVEGPDREVRFDTFLPAILSGDRAGRVEQVSAHGALLTTDAPLAVDEIITIEVEPAAGVRSTVTGRVVRVQHGRQYGIALTHADAPWGEYLRFLESWLWGSAPAGVPAAESPAPRVAALA